MQEDDAPLKKPAPLQAQLELASIDELHARIEALRAEIALCEAAIAAKQAQRSAADAFFGRPS
ncbi:MAG: DUF1192 domain-containing protein [Hyphomonadaceae bacterium]